MEENWYIFIKRAGLTHVMVLNLSHYKNLMFHLAKKKLQSEFDEPRYFEIQFNNNNNNKLTLI